MQNMIYIEMKEHVQVKNREVTAKDVADIFVIRSDESAAAPLIKKIEAAVIYRFPQKGSASSDNAKFQNRYIFSVMDLMESLHQKFPGYMILPLGQTDCVIELEKQKAGTKSLGQIIKIIFVCLLCVLGGAFSIMAFHNDIGITQLFSQVYELVTGKGSDGFTVLEISYSIGLFAGITVFYNHLGKKRITTDPTPIEVSMRSYEKDMDNALVQEWERKEKR